MLDSILGALIRPFRAQSVRVTSILAVGASGAWPEHGEHGTDTAAIAGADDTVLFRLAADADEATIVARVPIPSMGSVPHTLESVAREARARSDGAAGDPLIVVSARRLEEMIVLPSEGFDFRAVAVLSSRSSDSLADGRIWRLQRQLFDHGLVGIGSVQVAGGEARCFLAADAIRSVHGLGVGTRGHVTMSELGRGARFANQLFQYAYAKLYALRHGLTAAIPPWDGQQLFGLADPTCEGLDFPKRLFNGFTDEDRRLWDMDDPPIDIDLLGFFQEIPACWQNHRPLLRRLFQLPTEHQQAIDAWRANVTRGGRRTLVAIHVRRGDYRDLQDPAAPWFRIVPERWYLAWLRSLWPTLRDPLLFVATDEPEAIRPQFREFETVAATFGAPACALPDHVGDFEILRRADYLAICNSSFGRMAGILAPAAQRCFLASFPTQGFEPYEPWVDPGFWVRFGEWARAEEKHAEDPLPPRRNRPRSMLTAHAPEASLGAPSTPTIYFDVSDLLLYVQDHTTLSGIQRVECEIMRHLLDVPRPEPIRLVVLDDTRCLGVIETEALQDIVAQLRSDAAPGTDLDMRLSALLARMVPLFVRPGDIFLTVGAFWGVSGVGLLLQELKNRGVIVGVLVHDILPVTDPEYFDARDTRIFLKGLVTVLTFADFILTTSEYNRASVIEHLAARHLPPLPVHVVPLAHELSRAAPTEAKVGSLVAGISDTAYVLCVGTIEARKNPSYLFNIWRLMVRSGRTDIPTLVFVGRRGWLVQDFLEQLRVCNYLDGRIVVLHDVTDVELDLLYRKCILTMFPSMVEGWGLPVGESLAHGKICLASHAGGIPEVGGSRVDYVDPYNASGGLEVLLRYLDDPELRRRRERDIADHWEPRPWRKVADDFLNSAQALARQVGRPEGTAAIRLPSNRFLPISSDPGAILLDGLDGELCADLICISGWRPPETWGVWADAPAAILRFRADVPEGTAIHVVMRLIAAAGDRRHIRIASGSGAQTEVVLLGSSDRMAVLSCEVEPGDLVSLRMSMSPRHDARERYWGLKGILYYQPEHVAGQAPARSRTVRSAARRPAPASAPPPLVEAPDRSAHPSSSRGRVRLRPAGPMDESRRAASFGSFLRSLDSYWPSRFTTHRTVPIFADRADQQIFYDGHGRHVGVVTDQITLIRRSEQYVSTSRFSEGSVFDRAGVSRAFGYLEGSPPVPWLSREADGLWIDEASLAAAPRYDKSCLIFYNGNLHNYYHWMTEGIVSLDILSRALGADPSLGIVLPKSMEIAELFDHRESLRAVGLDGYAVVETGADLINVREAIWVESDLVQSMPAPYLKDFQRRVAARHAGARLPRRRRLLVARKGPTRKIANLEQVEACLGRYDFETVYLEGMSIVDQILLFQRAEFVIGPHGAGLANLLFCEPGTRVIEFMPSVEMRPFFWLISEKLDLVYGVQFCAAADDRGFQTDVKVDIDKLEALYRMVEAHR
ncbi:MAG TPA: glycosyltransferase 61 family protein [Candidatus Methylomirabilis sp.]|nr:glycosyltransferase 61 family protein [Candidatus Methylomirabilis sp.]